MAKYLTTPEAAEIAEVSVRAITQACTEGRLPAVKIGRQWMITKSGLRSYIASRKRAEKALAAKRKTAAKKVMKKTAAKAKKKTAKPVRKATKKTPAKKATKKGRK